MYVIVFQGEKKRFLSVIVSIERDSILTLNRAKYAKSRFQEKNK